jgi:hypothetical protein
MFCDALCHFSFACMVFSMFNCFTLVPTKNLMKAAELLVVNVSVATTVLFGLSV